MKNVLSSTAKRIVFTMAGGGQAASIFGLMVKRIAFTMAEILLSLTIIGVVAAITLPSLTGNINERTWNTQRKALHSRLSQAVALMPSIKGYGVLSSNAESIANGANVNFAFSSNDAAETFLSAGLAKVFKLNNICDNSHLSDCGLPDNFVAMNGSKIPLSSLKMLSSLNSVFSTNYCYNSPIDTDAAAFETANGESVLLHYNPICSFAHVMEYRAAVSPMCLNMIYDLNGKKGPNTVGKDVGVITVFYSNDSVVVSPIPAKNDLSGSYTADSAASACTALGEDYRVPNIEELTSLYISEKLFGISTVPNISSTKVESVIGGTYGSGEVAQRFDTPQPIRLYGDGYYIVGAGAGTVRCIKRFN